MKPTYQDYLKTDYWKAVTLKVKERAGFRCQLCNSQHDLQAHHRTYDHRGRELDFLADLTCLCRRCHAIFHGIVSPPTPPVVEQPIQPRLSKRERQKQKVYELPLPKIGRRFVIRPIVESEISAMMPEGDPIALTRELIDRLRTNGAFTSATLAALKWTDRLHGWPFRMEGFSVSAAQYRQALEGRQLYTAKGARNRLNLEAK